MKQATRIANRYEVIGKLGQGGMGAVWRVYDRLEHQEVALKQVLIPDKDLDFASKAGTDDTDKLRLSLAKEFSILATLRHPHILSVLDFGFDHNGHPFYTMTLLEGGVDAKSYAKDLSHEEKIHVLAQMLQALHYLHRRGILHRDLKPHNVLIDPDGQVKVMDFGLAKKTDQDSQPSEDSGIVGTMMYMAPELFKGEKASLVSDLYAFGLMAYEILTGAYPFEFDSIWMLLMKVMNESPDSSMLSGDLKLWIERLLEHDPDLRYQSAYDALQDLYHAQSFPMPAETQLIRESFLQASAFVGRDAELKQLTNRLTTLDDVSAFYLIGGESGVGKSRLLDELRIEALVRNALVMRGQGVEDGGLPFQLWRNIVRRMVLVVEVTDFQAGVLKDIVPDMDVLLGREIAKAPELTGKAYQDRIVLAIVDLFRQLPHRVVLLLEDLQWTAESLAVLEQMLKVHEQLPKLMIVATYRDDESPDLPDKMAGMTHIKLERLTSDVVSELSRAMLGDVGRNEDVVQLLHSQSEGNLFFFVETVRALAEASGDLQRIGQSELPEGVFTGGMQALTRRHLSKVDAQYSDIQTLAAIIGREIDTQLLAHAYDETSVQAWLSNASEYGVVTIRENTWRFDHDKLRETIIADISTRTLPNIHRNAAETIEAVYPENDGYNEALLAQWQQVGDLDKIYQYLLPVAENMINIRGTYDIAERHIQQMLGRLPASDARCVALWNWLARSAVLQSNFEISQHYSEQAQQLATKLHNQEGLGQSLNYLGQIAFFQRDYIRATELFQQSLEIHQELGDQSGIASNLNSLGIMAYSQGDFDRATGLYQQSLEIHRELGNHLSLASSLNNLGIIFSSQGDNARATKLFQQSLSIRREFGDQRGIASCLHSLGITANNQPDFDRATELFQQSLQIKQQLGDIDGVSITLNSLGDIAYSQGDYSRATELFQQSLQIRRQSGNQHGIEYMLMNLGRVALKQGDKQAINWFGQALQIAHKAQSKSEVLMAVICFARVIAEDGKAERSLQLVGLAESHRAKSSEIQHYVDEIMSLLETTLSPDDLAQAIERGKSLDLDTVVQELLDEFGGELSPEE